MSNPNSEKPDALINFSSNGGDLPPVENKGVPLLNKTIGMTEKYQSVLEPLRKALINWYETIPEESKELAHKVLLKIALPIIKTGSKKIDGYVPVMNIGSLKSNEETPANKSDRVNHPSHYTWLKDLCGIEVIDITRHMDFNLGNAIKYILRNGHKSEEGMSDNEKAIEDLNKAIFYIKDKIKMMGGDQ